MQPGFLPYAQGVVTNKIAFGISCNVWIYNNIIPKAYSDCD